MLSFIGYTDAKEQIEIVADEQGIDDLILYLQGIKEGKDHMHLIVDSEIDAYPVSSSKAGVTVIKHVRLEYANREQWRLS
ncbi:hypothetical protein IC229_21950 [Spirosoma sp. BT702]|uniref:Uncharacterized protein n=1 Tax=Spirosoma profusum TaxID=2771354 RepID=A0A926XYJ8_9BACT|nr:hypothetical protein [Spirosoma profusum]MBD2703324.1 hypothetical protein [Spirosoma profusum]